MGDNDNQDDDLFAPLVIEGDGGDADPASAPANPVVPADAAAVVTPEPDAGAGEGGDDPDLLISADGKTVPLGALKAVREENKTLKAKAAEAESLKAQLAALQAAPAQPVQPAQPQQPAQTLEDVVASLDTLEPDYGKKLAAVMQAQRTQVKLDLSQDAATREFGADVVKAAFEFFNTRPRHESEALLKERSPFHAAVAAYKRHQAMAEIGDDPAAFRARVEAEVLAKLQGGQSQPVTQKPSSPSLAGNPNLGSRATVEWTGPVPLDQILGG